MPWIDTSAWHVQVSRSAEEGRAVDAASPPRRHADARGRPACVVITWSGCVRLARGMGPVIADPPVALAARRR